MTVEEITNDKQLVEPQGLPPIPEEDILIFCKDCRQKRANQHFHQDDKVFKTCNMCRARRKKQRANRKANGKLAPSQVPEVKRQNDRIYNMTKRKPSPPKPRKALTEEQKAKKRAYNKAYNANMTEEQKERRREHQRAYLSRKKAEKEALAKL